MNARVAKRWAAVVLIVVAAGGCASGAWRWEPNVPEPSAFPPPPSAHRAVERVTLKFRGREFEFVGYRTCDPATRDVRVQLLLDSGISVLDVAAHDERNERIAGSAFEAIPRLADIAMDDLRRTWGSRSVFGVTAARQPYSFGGVSFDAGPRLTDGHLSYQAEGLVDGSCLAVAPRDVGSPDVLHVTLLDADLVPEATIHYSDFDEDGVPREIRLVDLRDGHTLDVEVEEVHVVGPKGGETSGE